MILHTDRYFEHLYDVKKDLVCVKWPTIETIYLPEIMHSVSMLVQNVTNFNVKNLLIDARESKVLASNEEANRVVYLLTEGLAKSRLEKLARVESANTGRELLLRQMVTEMNQQYPYEIRFFRELEAAQRWINGGCS